jgi:MFS transporter, SP family, xylose:H+ symportor
MAYTSPERGSMAYVYLLTSVAALGGLLFGYDTAVISGAIGFLEAHFHLDPQLWKGWAAASALIGCAAGAAVAGLLSDRLGRRLVLMISAVLFFISAIGTALPTTFTQFIVFRVIGGLGIGAASISSPMYIAEVAPARLRGRLVSLNQLAIVSGILLVYFVNYFIAGYGARVDPAWNVDYGWRWMFASGTVPSLLLLMLLTLVPESPRWLAEQNRPDEALRVLARVGGERQAQQELAESTDAIARETGSLAQLFEPGLRIVLLIGVALAVLQQVTGINVFLYYAPEIFKKMGSGVDAALLETVLIGGVNLSFTLVAIYTVDRLGRVPLMLLGASGMGLCLTAMGVAAYLQQTDVWVLLSIVGYIGCFALSVGPVTWVILSEIFPNRIRGRAMALATVCLWLANYVVTQTFTMMDEDAWLVSRFHHAFPFWMYALLCGVTVLFVWRFVPETKGKTLEEIERGWLSKGARG